MCSKLLPHARMRSKGLCDQSWHRLYTEVLCKKNRQPSDVNFTHARDFPFIFKVKLHACAKIDVEILCKITSVDYVTGIGNLHMRSTGTPCYGYQPSNG